jgi:hypothetical protein
MLFLFTIHHSPFNPSPSMTKPLLALLLLATPLAAQAPIRGPVPHRLVVTPRADARAPIATPRDVRASRAPRTLGIIGAVLGAAGGTFVGAAGCSFSDDDQRDCTAKMPLSGLSGAVITGGLFWLIGKAVS